MARASRMVLIVRAGEQVLFADEVEDGTAGGNGLFDHLGGAAVSRCRGSGAVASETVEAA